MGEFTPEPMGYYAIIRSGAETAEAHDGEVHDVLTVAGSPLSGFPPVVRMEPKPEVPPGKRLVRCYRRTAEAVELRYRLEDVPPRVFVTADLVEALMAEGIWTDVRAWIDSKGLLDLVLVTKEFGEDNANFKAGRAALQAALGWTDEEVEELLAKCVKEGA